MRYAIVFILCLWLASHAGANGWDGEQAPMNSAPPSTDAITLTVLDTWSPVNEALGLDFLDAGAGYVMGVDSEGMVIRWYLGNGTPSGVIPLSSSNGSCFGISWNNNYDTECFYTSDWNASNLFYTENFGTSWTTVPSPSGTNTARGMDFDGTHYWTTNGVNGGLWRFQPGVGQTNISIPQVTTQPSGLTVFEYGSSFGVAVTTYSNHNIWFYSWNGSSLSFLGSAACPVACASSYGLAYSAYYGTIFWSYRDSGSNCWISELDFDINVSLERDTWGAIKASF